MVHRTSSRDTGALQAAHGGTLRMLDAYLRRIPVERMSWEPPANGRILRSPAWRLDHVTNPSEREDK